MPFPIVAVAVGAVAAASLPYLLYGQVAYFPSDDPTEMDPATLKSVNDALMSVHQKLVERGSEFGITQHVPAGKSCVEASEKRGSFIASLLSNKWQVFSYTVSAETHTFNVVRYDDHRQIHYWIIDSYLIVYIKYVGSSPPVGMTQTPQSKSYWGHADSYSGGSR